MKQEIIMTIRDDLPVPPPRSRWNFQIEELKVGQAVEVKASNEDAAKRASLAASALLSRLKKKGDKRVFRVHKIDETTFGIWRDR